MAPVGIEPQKMGFQGRRLRPLDHLDIVVGIDKYHNYKPCRLIVIGDRAGTFPLVYLLSSHELKLAIEPEGSH